MGYLGVYDRTIFFNPSNGYSIISVKTSDQNVPECARSAYKHRDHLIRFVAVGYELPLTDKVSMILDGEWQNGKHGLQLQVESCEEIVPQTVDGIKGYLSSRLIKGVGEKTADESHCMRDLMLLLSPFKVSAVTAAKIYEHFGTKSVDILRKNPYELCQIPGFGFKRVDAIVLKGDCPPNSPMRIHGAIYAALDAQRSDNGHLFLESETLMKTMVQLLNEKLPLPQMRVKADEINAVMEQMILHGEIVSNNVRIYQVKCFVQEDETAQKIAQMLSEIPDRADVSSTLAQVLETLGITLSQRQSEAVYMAFHHHRRARYR